MSVEEYVRETNFKEYVGIIKGDINGKLYVP
jgi:hypothetical protein